MTGVQPSRSADPSREGFLALPGEVRDWRTVVLTDAALATGLLAALPASAAEAASRLGLSDHAVRIVLDALREFGVVERNGERYHLGPAAPDDAAAATVQHHARVLRSWSSALPDRLAGTQRSAGGDERTAAERARWLQALAVTARHRAPEVADHCLQRFADTRRVLDLAGGHGEYGLEFARRGLDVTLQDLPEVIEIVSTWGSLRNTSVTLVPGDAFEGLASGPFDLVLAAGFTHTLRPDANAELFKKLDAVTAPNGGVAVVTFLRGRRPIAPLFAVQMLVAGGGDTHGLDDYQRWLTAAGFDAPEVVDLEYGTSLLTAAR
ncbi:MAG: class I SAM-dependent methyltransferase [Egibacteraceae bacterium]